MTENKQHDQADNLRQKVSQQGNEKEYEQDNKLPPRREVHQDNKKPVKVKISFPMLRLLFVLFLILVGLLVSYKYWGDDFLLSAELFGNNTDADKNAAEIVFIQPNVNNNPGVDITEEKEYQVHTVEEKDTLESIAEKYYQDTDVVDYLIEVNQLEGRDILEGQELIIPYTIPSS
ncbi:LysM peptidoglycan-binding domain-containing protein [Saliterribacillus persicus]|uniref:LysM domain-containing protein n=1 Tax=Saliterribacillus persicus TaxID=930114 RepID=A0A368XAK7_9BACI|nr:LysM peptidoglycan-binding domain-containing protein [Saliterribacillus persicus]RCW64885.1 LysM domain-containing protein [Saliterribacillus persicus]